MFRACPYFVWFKLSLISLPFTQKTMDETMNKGKSREAEYYSLHLVLWVSNWYLTLQPSGLALPEYVPCPCACRLAYMLFHSILYTPIKKENELCEKKLQYLQKVTDIGYYCSPHWWNANPVVFVEDFEATNVVLQEQSQTAWV